MFDLNKAVAEWRHNFAEASDIGDEDLDELESHLRDEIDELASAGLATEEAFRKAVTGLGEASELNKEFSKADRSNFGLLAFINGKVLTMSNESDYDAHRLVWLPLFGGFWALAGCVLVMWYVGTSKNVISGILGALIWGPAQDRVFALSLLFWSLLFVAVSVSGLYVGFRRLRRRKHKTTLLAGSLIPGLVLSAILCPYLVFYTPVWVGCVQAAFSGPRIAMSVVSPDGNFEAYVVDEPSVDPPNQSIFIQRSDGIHFKWIAELAEDIDSIGEIHWSPQSDIVVFQTRCNLIAVHLPGYDTVKIPLDKEWKRAQPSKRSTFCGAGPRFSIAAIEFPKPGSFSYLVEGSGESKIIEMDSL